MLLFIKVLYCSLLGCHQTADEREEFIELYEAMKNGSKLGAVLEMCMTVTVWNNFDDLDMMFLPRERVDITAISSSKMFLGKRAQGSISTPANMKKVEIDIVMDKSEGEEGENGY